MINFAINKAFNKYFDFGGDQIDLNFGIFFFYFNWKRNSPHYRHVYDWLP